MPAAGPEGQEEAGQEGEPDVTADVQQIGLLSYEAMFDPADCGTFSFTKHWLA